MGGREGRGWEEEEEEEGGEGSGREWKSEGGGGGWGLIRNGEMLLSFAVNI